MVKETEANGNNNGKILCQDSIQKKMENVKLTFQNIPEGEKPCN